MRRVVFIHLLGHLVGGCRNLAAGMSVASALLLALAYGLVPVASPWLAASSLRHPPNDAEPDVSGSGGRTGAIPET